jgi:hypothetical protein
MWPAQLTTPLHTPSVNSASQPLAHTYPLPAPQPVFQRCLAKGILSQADVAAMALAFIARLPDLVDENAKAPMLVARFLGRFMVPAPAAVADMAKALREAGGWQAGRGCLLTG